MTILKTVFSTAFTTRVLACLISLAFSFPSFAVADIVDDLIHTALSENRSFLSQLSAIRQYEELVRQSQGALDTEIKAKAVARQHTTYNGDELQIGMHQTIPFANMNANAGIRFSRGSFAPYDGASKTLDRGEVFAGLEWDVLAAFTQDKVQFAIYKEKQNLEKQRINAEVMSLKLQESVINAFADFALGKANTHARLEQFQLTQTRAEMIRRKIATGDLSRIHALENEQYFLKQENDYLSALQSVSTATNLLNAVMFGDESWRTRMPSDILFFFESVTQRVRNFEPGPSCLHKHPLIKLAEIDLEVLTQHQEILRTERLPSLDFSSRVARDYGSGSPELRGTELKVGAEVSYPLASRNARAGASSKEWERSAKEQQMLQTFQDIKAAETNLRSLFATFLHIAMNTEKEKRIAVQLAAAERQKWLSGDSSLLNINIREKLIVAAALKHNLAIAQLWKAWASRLSACAIQL